MASQIYRLIIVGIILFNFISNCYADHILGGQIGIKEIGGNVYTIKLELYRACFSGGSDFDNPAQIAIYRESSSSFLLLANIPSYDPVIETIDPLQDDCMYSPYPFCIEKATYEHDQYLLLSHNENYYLAYQRCCRNPIYGNIITPGEVGITVWVKIPNTVLNTSNNTPNLSSNLFFETCSGEEFEFEITAEDDEGDELFYNLWYPYSGGGQLNNCDGPQPNPPCPPPYNPVEFASPNYSFDLPLGTGSILTINENTGVISGKPELLGQFLVGVRITEYRNGELISVSHQDITFRVDIATATNNIKFNSLSLSPNPVKDILTVKLPSITEKYKLCIRNINGTIIKYLEVTNTDKIDLDLNNLSGIYFIELKSSTEIYLEKIVVL